MYRREIEALVRESAFGQTPDGATGGLQSFVARHGERLELAVACMVVLWAVLADAWAIWVLFLGEGR